MTYKIHKHDDLFQVIELATEKVVFESSNYDESYSRYQFLKKDGGFAGWTPAFMNIKIPAAKLE